MPRNATKSLIINVLLAVVGTSQSGTSVISGTIKDSSGLAVPSARIKVVNEQSGADARTPSAMTLGFFRATVVSLLPGLYKVEVEAPGFQKLLRGPITAVVGQVLSLDLTLEIGKASEIVTVTEAAPLAESQSSNVAQLVNREMLAGLPLPNRAASSLAALSPGVVMIDSGAGTAENYPVFSVAGGRARNQAFMLDGGNVSNAVGLTRPQQLTSLPVDAMQEFRVIANSYAAEYGHSTGGIITMSTRSGTNQYHGSLFESLQNDVFNARNFFSANRSPVRLNQYGELWRADPKGQNALLPDLGANTATDQLRHRLHRANTTQPPGRFLRSPQHGGQICPDLRSLDRFDRCHPPTVRRERDPGAAARPRGTRRDGLFPAAQSRGHRDECQ